jgi:hypothetical protein
LTRAQKAAKARGEEKKCVVAAADDAEIIFFNRHTPDASIVFIPSAFRLFDDWIEAIDY